MTVDKEVDRVYDYIKYQETLSKKQLNIFLKDKLDYAYNRIKTIYNKNKNLSEDKILDLIKDALSDIRFSDGSYYFIYSMDGTNLMHPTMQHLEGKNLISYQDNKGAFIIKDMIKRLTLDDEAFNEWYWSKPGEDPKKEFKKIGYFKKFKELNFFIGIGVYEASFEENLKKEILDFITKIKFGKNGYIFVLNYEGKVLAYPKNQLINKEILDAKDKNGKEFIKDIINLSKNNKGDL